MRQNKLVLITVTVFTFCYSSLISSVENSVIPLIDKFESIENLNPKKLPDSQYAELVEVLKNKDQRIRLATYNILFTFYDHNLEFTNRWPQRFPRVLELLDEMQADIIGVQEFYPDQVEDIMPHLTETYEFYSRPCEDGELNGIFYKKDRFDLIDSKVFFMSPSASDEQSSDTLTMVQLKDKLTDRVFAVFNTHLAFSNINKRDFQARFIAEHIETYAQMMPVLLTGDMNTFPGRFDKSSMPAFDGDYVLRILKSGSLRNSQDFALLGHLGPLSTFTNDDTKGSVQPFQGTGTPGVILDHILTSKGINVLIHAIQSGTVDGNYPSDHMPVVIDFLVE